MEHEARTFAGLLFCGKMVFMRDKRDQPDSGSDMQKQVLMISVSLFMAVLAFFIVLNAFSNESAEKQRSVQKSLAGSFGFIAAGLAFTDTLDQGAGSAGDMEQAAASGLRSVLPDLGFSSRSTGASGRIMAVTIPRAELEERWPALRSRLGDLMVNKNTGGRHALQLLALDGASGAANLAPLANELIDEGVDEDLLGVGYEDRGQAAVELRFILSGGGA